MKCIIPAGMKRLCCIAITKQRNVFFRFRKLQYFLRELFDPRWPTRLSVARFSRVGVHVTRCGGGRHTGVVGGGRETNRGITRRYALAWLKAWPASRDPLMFNAFPRVAGKGKVVRRQGVSTRAAIFHGECRRFERWDDERRFWQTLITRSSSIFGYFEKFNSFRSDSYCIANKW